MDALACFLLFQILTETRIVLKKIQKLQALFQVVAAVAAVTPRGHTEAAGVYVVGGHDCALKRKTQGMLPSCVDTDFPMAQKETNVGLTAEMPWLIKNAAFAGWRIMLSGAFSWQFILST